MNFDVIFFLYKKKQKKILLCLISSLVVVISLLFTTYKAYAQNEMNLSFHFYSSVSSKNNQPFWIHSLRNGIFDPFHSNAIGQLQFTTTNSILSNLNYTIGSIIRLRQSNRSRAYIDNIYAELQWGRFQFQVGKIYYTIGNQSNNLVNKWACGN